MLLLSATPPKLSLSSLSSSPSSVKGRADTLATDDLTEHTRPRDGQADSTPSKDALTKDTQAKDSQAKDVLKRMKIKRNTT